MHKQHGAVLPVSLILMLILSMVGIQGMRSTALEERMAGNFQDSGLAFQAAEAALREAEEFVKSTSFDREIHLIEDCSADQNCFDAGCEGGLCLTGYIDGGCFLRDDENRPWVTDETENRHLTDDARHDGSGDLVNVWTTPELHKTAATTLSGVSSPAKYIVEFRCFSPKDPLAPSPASYPSEPASWAELYRVTVLGTGGRDSNQIMLQSLIRKD